MSSPLDRIEARVEWELASLRKVGGGMPETSAVLVTAADVLALVAVARAAEPFAEPFRFPEYQHVLALREALAALGKEPA